MAERPSDELLRRSAAKSIRQRGKVLHGRGADGFAKAEGEDRARHADAFSQRLQRPGMSRVVVHGGNGDAHVFVRQSGKPARTGVSRICQVQAQRLDEHRIGKMLRNQRSTGSRVAEFLTHPFERPAHGGFVRLAANVDDGRQRLQEHFGMAAAQGEVTSGDVSRAFGNSRGLAPHAEPGTGVRIENRFEREVCGELKRQSTREQKAVAGLEQHWPGHAFDHQPAVPGKHGVTFDAPMFWEVNGHVTHHCKAAGDVNLRFYQGENFGERVHVLARPQLWLQGRRLRTLRPGT